MKLPSCSQKGVRPPAAPRCSQHDYSYQHTQDSSRGRPSHERNACDQCSWKLCSFEASPPRHPNLRSPPTDLACCGCLTIHRSVFGTIWATGATTWPIVKGLSENSLTDFGATVPRVTAGPNRLHWRICLHPSLALEFMTNLLGLIARQPHLTGWQPD